MVHLVEEIRRAQHNDDRQTSDDHGGEGERPTPVVVVYLSVVHDGIAPPVVDDNAIQAHEHRRREQNEGNERRVAVFDRIA